MECCVLPAFEAVDVQGISTWPHVCRAPRAACCGSLGVINDPPQPRATASSSQLSTPILLTSSFFESPQQQQQQQVIPRRWLKGLVAHRQSQYRFANLVSGPAPFQLELPLHPFALLNKSSQRCLSGILMVSVLNALLATRLPSSLSPRKKADSVGSSERAARHTTRHRRQLLCSHTAAGPRSTRALDRIDWWPTSLACQPH